MERERLKYCIGRWDHYYDSVNNKSAVFLGLGTFIVGGLVAAYPAILEKVACNCFIHILMGLLIGIGVAIMIIVIKASIPYLGQDDRSLLYFGTVSSLTEDEFCERSISCTADEDIVDLRKQAHQLSIGLKNKFERLKVAGILFTIQFYLFIPLLLTIIFNLK